ncbi:hypothetical protein RJT34_31860 [Clitoria ternatea]|uniref:Transcription factor n=1 Tax=Clitoria ternatea TaxID=43366 RepID=A0AAN9EV16_CLITE
MSTMQGQEVVTKGSKCEDCGNQAKKDCAYSRCRTCCKNKGFRCQTHVRSTWIPVDKRRQRLMDHLQGGDAPKKHKHNPYSSLEELKFPGVMSSMALFSCVKVRSMDDTVNEIAYQTSVNIGGHVFSGLLYDQGQGPEQRGEIDPLLEDQQHNNLNLGTSIHTHHGGATMPQLLSATTASQEYFFPPLASSFRPGMTYLPHTKS